MKAIGVIAAMTQDRVIGVNNTIPWHYSEDFNRFKRLTLGSAIIMGRKTWQSLGCKPLLGRRNIVISRNIVANCEHYQTIPQALDACDDDAPVWFIGGGQIYSEALAHCTHLDITTVPDIIDPGNAVLFPEIDAQIWQAQPSTTLKADPRLHVQLFKRRDLQHGD